ncbi:MAG: dTMP kinase [SAR202 cluster bacterium Io17-Chloro-G4]|nr:MAG: dTMP kinase [SAR202 cluster bacterium Io17-Chloro-G4]
MASFIVFEGIDGSGKSTQAKALLQRLRRRNIPALLTHEPGGTPLGEQLRRWLKGRADLSPLAELTLFVAARAQLVDKVITPALKSGVTVISDRFTASTVAYQGHGRGLDLDLINGLNVAATGGLAPGLTILIDMPPEESLARRNDAGQDSFESAPWEFHRKVRESYLAQAAANPDDWLLVDGAQDKRRLGQQIWEKVKPLL